MSPLGETLRRARQSKGNTIEDAERVTRIPRKYLEALEQENFSILPAPVYARGFLRSYAGYLGLDPGELLPFFPVGHVEEPRLEPLPEVRQPRTWSMSGAVAAAAVGALILIVVSLYTFGQESGGRSLLAPEEPAETVPQVVVPPSGEPAGQEPSGPAVPQALPDLAGLSLEEAVRIVEEAGAAYVVIGVREGDVPVGQIVNQEPAPGEAVVAGGLVTLIVSR